MRVYTLKQPLVFAMQFDSIDRYEEILLELANVHGFLNIQQDGDPFRPTIRLGNQELERGVIGSKYVNLGDYIVTTTVPRQFDVMSHQDFEHLYTPFFE